MVQEQAFPLTLAAGGFERPCTVRACKGHEHAGAAAPVVTPRRQENAGAASSILTPLRQQVSAGR